MTFLSGWLKFVARPALTGSSPPARTMGMVSVAARAIRAVSVPSVTMMSTLSDTNVFASSGRRSTYPAPACAQNIALILNVAEIRKAAPQSSHYGFRRRRSSQKADTGDA